MPELLQIKDVASYLPYKLEGVADFLNDTIFIVDEASMKRRPIFLS